MKLTFIFVLMRIFSGLLNSGCLLQQEKESVSTAGSCFSRIRLPFAMSSFSLSFGWSSELQIADFKLHLPAGRQGLKKVKSKT